jgi:hypothetical protein
MKLLSLGPVVVLSAAASVAVGSIFYEQADIRSVASNGLSGPKDNNPRIPGGPGDTRGPNDGQDPRSVPEPSTLLLLGAAGGLVAIRKLRHRKNDR